MKHRIIRAATSSGIAAGLTTVAFTVAPHIAAASSIGGGGSYQWYWFICSIWRC